MGDKQPSEGPTSGTAGAPPSREPVQTTEPANERSAESSEGDSRMIPKPPPREAVEPTRAAESEASGSADAEAARAPTPVVVGPTGPTLAPRAGEPGPSRPSSVDPSVVGTTPTAIAMPVAEGTSPTDASASDSSPESRTRIPERITPPSSLRPELQRRVEEIARRQEEELRRSQRQPAPSARDVGGDLKTQTQVDISRAPSPAEARPIRAIPVPEDWVPLARREWSPQRKYWAAAATCHMPLYFQDTMLERYGHSVEAYFGPAGRCMTYPVDDPRQSTQRNQIAQPFFSAGLFAWQIITLPYALVVDPPWEAQYDLGYWRPGDRIPSDLYYQPLHGTGPPLRGRAY
jgi:hypothetical protein